MKKGGYVFVKFFGDVVRIGEFCFIGEVNWYKVDKSYKVNIIVLVRVGFLNSLFYLFFVLVLSF